MEYCEDQNAVFDHAAKEHASARSGAGFILIPVLGSEFCVGGV